MVKRKAWAVIGAGLTMAGAACAPTVIELEGVSTETTKDVSGAVTAVTLIADFAELEAIVAKDGYDIAGASVDFDADAQALGTTRHAQLDYNPFGHGPPGVNDNAHFDFHFYGITEEERLAIDCSGEVDPPAEKVPQGYLNGGLGEVPFGSCVRQMGVHFSPPLEEGGTEHTGTVHGDVMIMGYSKGELVFYEPMIPADHVMNKESFSLAVPRPDKLGRDAQWPDVIDGAYDEATNSYRVSARQFGPIE